MRRAIATLVSLLALTALAGPPAAAPATRRPSVAILYFDDDGTAGEIAVLKKGLAQMLITDLVGHPNVTVVERARIEEIFAELKLSETKKIDPATALKLNKLLAAEYQVQGAYFVTLGQMIISANVVNVEKAQTIASVRVKGSPDNFFDLQADLSAKLTDIFNTKVPATALPPKEGKAPPARPAKSNVKVALGYSRALDAIDKKDKATAKKELEAVMKEQPDFVLASLDLAELVK